jgi:hypothetical protein
MPGETLELELMALPGDGRPGPVAGRRRCPILDDLDDGRRRGGGAELAVITPVKRLGP